MIFEEETIIRDFCIPAEANNEWIGFNWKKKDAWFSVLMIWGYDIAWMVNESNECYKHPNEYLSGVQIKKTDWSSKSSSSGHNM